MHENKWKDSEINLLLTASAICGAQTKKSRTKPVQTYDESIA
jgi:hypothetical protein